MKKLRLCGDVHGNISAYIDLVKNFDYSIQLGDLGFKYKPIIMNLSSHFHKVLGGNHDNYTLEKGVFVHQTSHFLGDYGVHDVPEIGSFFFVRGGQSIDKSMRLVGIDWWLEEELSYGDCAKVVQLYEQVKPAFVITHECPESIIPYVSNMGRWNGLPVGPSKTALLLQNLFEIHQPKFWFFGHHHKSWSMIVNGTNFRCLNELEVFDIPEGGLK